MDESTAEAPEPGPDYTHESAARRRGITVVAGVDEAGRGPLAGPVVTAAVILDSRRIPRGLDDSKKLMPERRAELFEKIIARATVSICIAPPSIIATRNIRGATLWAMTQAVLGLAARPGLVLVDGKDVPPGLPCDGKAIIGGDGRSVSVAAASIVAKVTRDRMCAIMDCDAPGFGFAAHKGYSTEIHLESLAALGPSRHHRRDFAPVAALLEPELDLVNFVVTS